MHLRRALFIAACLLPVAPAAAQAPWPGQTQPQSAEPATAPWPGQTPQQPAAQSPWPQQSTQPAAPPPQAPQAGPSPWSQPPKSEPPCIKEFVSLRADAQKKAGAIQQASKGKKMTAQQACNLFSSFSAAEAKLIKYAIRCGVGASLRALKERSDLAKSVMSGETPEDLLKVVAAAQDAEPDLGIEGVHFFTIGDPASSVRWAEGARSAPASS